MPQSIAAHWLPPPAHLPVAGRQDHLARPCVSEIWAARLLAEQAKIIMLGQLDRAAELAEQALAEAERTGDRFAAGYALHTLSLVAFLRRDHAAHLRHIDRALEVIGDDPQHRPAAAVRGRVLHQGGVVG
jgi:hypothetical protein